MPTLRVWCLLIEIYIHGARHAWVIVMFRGRADITIIITENRSCEEGQVKEVKMSE